MGGKSNSAPDYRGAAEEQGRSSIEAIEAQTKANRPNQYTPWGSPEWQQQDGNWTQNINLSQGQQGALDDQMAIQGGRSAIAKGMLGNANQEMDTPKDFWNTLPQPGGAANVPDFYGQGLSQMGQGPDPRSGTPFPTGGGQGGGQGGRQPGGMFGGGGGGRGGGRGIQRQVEGGDYNPDFAQTQFDRQMSLAQPQMERQTQQLETQLRNQGLSPGTPAYDNAISDMRNQQGEQTSRMQQDAMRLGANEQQNQFGRNLQGGQFANQAQGQQFGQQQTIQGGRGQAAQAQFQREMAVANQRDRQRQQQVNEQLSFGGQGFDQQMRQSGMQNQVRQQAIAEQMQREGWSLNKINAMLSGQQVGMPSMPNFQAAGAAQPTQYLSAANMQGQQQQQGQSDVFGALGSIGGGLFGGPVGAALGGKIGGMIGG